MGLVCQSGTISLSSNGNYQTESSVFSQQSNGAVDERIQRCGGQDKTALRAVPVPSRQPEPVRSKARSQAVNTKPQRSQKRSSTKRKTIHLVLWVNPIVKAHLQRVAAQEGLSMSKAGGVPLSRALQQNIDVTTPSAFLLTASRETHTLWVTLPPDGSVRAGEFLTQPHDPGKLTGGRWDNDATCSAASWELLAHKYIVGLCHVGFTFTISRPASA